MTNTTDQHEMVSHPEHYDCGSAAYEPYKVIAAWGCNFAIGSAIKYLTRYKKKWNAVEDLQKAKQYIDFEIERLLNSPKQSEDEAEDTESPHVEESEELNDAFDNLRKELAKIPSAVETKQNMHPDRLII